MPVNGYGLVYPDTGAQVDVPADMLALANSVGPYLNMRFTNATARDALLTAPVEGMVAWLQDINQWTYYDGSAWRLQAPFAMAGVSVTLTSAPAVGSLTQAFTWPAGRFTQAPLTVITNVGGTGSSSFVVQLNSPATTSGGTVLISHKDAGSTSTVTMTVHILGIQMLSSAAAG